MPIKRFYVHVLRCNFWARETRFVYKFYTVYTKARHKLCLENKDIWIMYLTFMNRVMTFTPRSSIKIFYLLISFIVWCLMKKLKYWHWKEIKNLKLFIQMDSHQTTSDLNFWFRWVINENSILRSLILLK